MLKPAAEVGGNDSNGSAVSGPALHTRSNVSPSIRQGRSDHAAPLRRHRDSGRRQLRVENESGGGEILSATQLFKNRELWGYDAHYLYAGPQSGRLAIPTGVHERLFALGLRSYLEFATQCLEVDFPVTVVLGVTNVRGHMLAMPRARYWDDFGPIQEDNIIVRETLPSGDDQEIDRVLRKFFEAIFDAAGVERPDHFNGFPGEKPGALPSSG